MNHLIMVLSKVLCMTSEIVVVCGAWRFFSQIVIKTYPNYNT